MNAMTKVLVPALLILALAIPAFCIGGVDADDSDAGGGREYASFQDDLTEETDYVDVELTFEGNDGWTDDERVKVDISVQYGDYTTTHSDITSDKTLSDVKCGSVITLKIEEGTGSRGNEVRYLGIDEGGKEYSLGLASGEDGSETPWNEFTLEITDDTEFIVDCSGSRMYNPITITNNSDADLYLYGKIRVNGASEPVMIEPGSTMKIWGNRPHDDNSWFRVEFDSDDKIPVVDFVDSSYAPGSGITHSIGDGFFETLSDNKMAEIKFDLIDESELVDFPEGTLVEGKSYPITINPELNDTVGENNPSYNEAKLDWSSSDSNIAFIGHDGKLHCRSDGECTISLRLTYSSNFIPESEFPIGHAITFDVVVCDTYSITINGSDNGSVTADPTTATEGQTITLTVLPDAGYILDYISTTSELELTQTEYGFSFTMPAEDVILTPYFAQATHTVKFHDGEDSWEESFYHRAPLQFPDDPSKESDPQWDYVFAGWVDSKGDVVKEGTPVTDEMELFSTYNRTERLYDIDFVVNGIVIAQYDMAYGTVIITPPDPYVEGYDFVGWRDYTQGIDFIQGMTVTDDFEFHAVFVESSEPMPPWQGDYDPPYIPPNIVVEKSENGDCLWIFIVLGSVATLLFLLFAYFERRDGRE